MRFLGKGSDVDPWPCGFSLISPDATSLIRRGGVAEGGDHRCAQPRLAQNVVAFQIWYTSPVDTVGDRSGEAAVSTDLPFMLRFTKPTPHPLGLSIYCGFGFTKGVKETVHAIPSGSDIFTRALLEGDQGAGTARPCAEGFLVHLPLQAEALYCFADVREDRRLLGVPGPASDNERQSTSCFVCARRQITASMRGSFFDVAEP